MTKNGFILILISLFLFVTNANSQTVKLQLSDDYIIDCEFSSWYSHQSGTNYFCYGDQGVEIGSPEYAEITFAYSNERWERYYYRIPIPTFLQQIPVEKAIMNIYKTQLYLTLDSTDFQLSVSRLDEPLYPIYESYRENGIIAPLHSEFVYDTTNIISGEYIGWVSLDITELYNLWVLNEISNNGLVIKMKDEEYPTQKRIFLYQSSNPDSLLRPYIELFGTNFSDTTITVSDYHFEDSPTTVNNVQTLENDRINLNCYPNPFNSNSIIEFKIPQMTNIKIYVYDLLGRRVKTLLNENKEIGEYKINFNSDKLPSGVYFIGLITEYDNKFIKIISLK